ncbi:hypothetical protein K469DRAFT_208964 [Zopfia rhizophila CBS 207.26]|uniref:Uncharacterized protein n=1 Tax=Zopfia rhizophila CBS 207.26 TaxID=1314779 RepID=A0A6A6DV24_9PEZI|nr:hypothetical protein K469DRAFT_208964 [Zopfia rhizophila CBS 207.26]
MPAGLCIAPLCRNPRWLWTNLAPMQNSTKQRRATTPGVLGLLIFHEVLSEWDKAPDYHLHQAMSVPRDGANASAVAPLVSVVTINRPQYWHGNLATPEHVDA